MTWIVKLYTGDPETPLHESDRRYFDRGGRRYDSPEEAAAEGEIIINDAVVDADRLELSEEEVRTLTFKVEEAAA